MSIVSRSDADQNLVFGTGITDKPTVVLGNFHPTLNHFTDPTVVAAWRGVLLSLADPETPKRFTKSEFVEGTDVDFTPVRVAMQVSEVFAS